MLKPSYTCARCLRASRLPLTSSRLGRATSIKPQATPFSSSRSLTTQHSAQRSNTRPSAPFRPPQTHQQRHNTTTATPSTPSTTPPLSSPPAPAIRTLAIHNPRHDPSGPLTLNLTPRAATRLTQLIAKDANPQLCLRLTVESGGCHGFQYLMSLTSTGEIDTDADTIFAAYPEGDDLPGGEGEADLGTGRAKVVVDEASLGILRGASVDYSDELIGSQFKVVGIPGATSSCGCGSSFDVQL